MRGKGLPIVLALALVWRAAIPTVSMKNRSSKLISRGLWTGRLNRAAAAAEACVSRQPPQLRMERGTGECRRS
jgi:hypothetical protein